MEFHLFQLICAEHYRTCAKNLRNRPLCRASCVCCWLSSLSLKIISLKWPKPNWVRSRQTFVNVYKTQSYDWMVLWIKSMVINSQDFPGDFIVNSFCFMHITTHCTICQTTLSMAADLIMTDCRICSPSHYFVYSDLDSFSYLFLVRLLLSIVKILKKILHQFPSIARTSPSYMHSYMFCWSCIYHCQTQLYYLTAFFVIK